MENKHIVYMMVGIQVLERARVRKNAEETWVIVSPDVILETQYNMSGHLKPPGMGTSYQQFGRGLLGGQTMVWDATFTSPIMRAAILHTAKGAGYRVAICLL